MSNNQDSTIVSGIKNPGVFNQVDMSTLDIDPDAFNQGDASILVGEQDPDELDQEDASILVGEQDPDELDQEGVSAKDSPVNATIIADRIYCFASDQRKEYLSSFFRGHMQDFLPEIDKSNKSKDLEGKSYFGSYMLRAYDLPSRILDIIFAVIEVVTQHIREFILMPISLIMGAIISTIKSLHGIFSTSPYNWGKDFIRYYNKTQDVIRQVTNWIGIGIAGFITIIGASIFLPVSLLIGLGGFAFNSVRDYFQKGLVDYAVGTDFQAVAQAVGKVCKDANLKTKDIKRYGNSITQAWQESELSKGESLENIVKREYKDIQKNGLDKYAINKFHLLGSSVLNSWKDQYVNKATMRSILQYLKECYTSSQSTNRPPNESVLRTFWSQFQKTEIYNNVSQVIFEDKELSSKLQNIKNVDLMPYVKDNMSDETINAVQGVKFIVKVFSFIGYSYGVWQKFKDSVANKLDSGVLFCNDKLERNNLPCIKRHHRDDSNQSQPVTSNQSEKQHRDDANQSQPVTFNQSEKQHRDDTHHTIQNIFLAMVAISLIYHWVIKDHGRSAISTFLLEYLWLGAISMIGTSYVQSVITGANERTSDPGVEILGI